MDPTVHLGPAQGRRAESRFVNLQDLKPVPEQRKLWEGSQTKASGEMTLNSVCCTLGKELQPWEHGKYLIVGEFPTYMGKTLY